MIPKMPADPGRRWKLERSPDTMVQERGPVRPAGDATRERIPAMANPFSKAWKYLMALFSSKVDEYADPKVQIQQAIEDAQRQHAELSKQAAAVIGNQRQLEMKLTRQMSDVERLQSSARQALVLSDEARSKG